MNVSAILDRYLDVSGLKRSTAYMINGVIIFFSWLVSRLLVFVPIHMMLTCKQKLIGYMLST